MPTEEKNWRGYEWVALSVNTVGALLIALPDIMIELHAGFMTIMWVMLGFMIISSLGLLGLSFVMSSTPYWLLALYQALMGGGSGLFASPNTNAIMSSVVSEKRGTAAGINYMLMSTGQMLSIAIVFPLVLSRIPEEVMFHVFLYGGGMNGAPLAAFESGMYQAFLAFFSVTILAAVISGLRPWQKHFG